MPINIVKSSLDSRVVRQSIGNKILSPSLDGQEQTGDQGGVGGIISRLITGGFRVGGWLVGVVSQLVSWAVNLTALWGLIVQTVSYIYTFNWNTTDQQIDQQIRNQFAALSGMTGEALGEAFGWLACGALPGMVIVKFNKALGLYILKEVGEEAFEEITAQMAAIVQTVARGATTSFFLWYFRSIRRLTKGGFNPVGEFFLKTVFGEEWFAQWGADNAKPWSFSKAVNDRIESIDNETLQNFVENFFEGFTDACVEAGFVVANAADSWIAEQALTQKNPLGPERVLEVQPDRTIEKEKLVVAGPQELIKPVVVQALTTHQQLDNRDVGQWVGIPKEEYVMASPAGLRAVIMLHGVKEPPWGTSRRVQISIPDLRRSAIDWERIKLALGGSNGYLYGRFKAVALLNSGRKITAWASTSQDAKDRVEALLQFTESDLAHINVSEETRTGQRIVDSQLQKEPERVYPGTLTLYNRVELLDRTRGRASPRQESRYEEREGRIDLWVDTKPFDFDDVVNRLLTQGF